MAYSLGKSIRTLKAQKNLTNEQVGKIVNRDKVTISFWINGVTVPHIDVIVNLCESVGIEFSQFAKWGEDN